MFLKVVLRELLTDCDVDMFRDLTMLFLLAIVDGLKRLVSLNKVFLR